MLPRPSDAPRLSARHRRVVLDLLSREDLAGIADTFDVAVEDRRSKDAHIDAIVRSRKVDFAAVLVELRREDLQAACDALGLDRGGREKATLVERILALGSNGDDNGNGNGVEKPVLTLEPNEPARPKAKRSTTRSSVRSTNGEPAADYRHDATRKNNPPAGLAELEKPAPRPTRTYAYDPHLDPQLEWAGKTERSSFEIDTVSLHIHERVSTQAILRAVKREEAQRSLFEETRLSDSKAIDFYAHDVGWANRLILGDSLLVMNSLLEREQMAGKVQCIYIDPPYGVKFNSNFQPSISTREVKDGDDASLTREPEQIQAFRDTWTLGIHSYLTYMRDRLLLARELLHESGSVFVQISDENVHHVRELMDEVLGGECFIVTFCVKKKGSQKSGLIDPVNDYVLWYGKSPRKSGLLTHRVLYERRELDAETLSEFKHVETRDGKVHAIRAVPDPNGREADYRMNPRQLFRDHPGARLFRPWPITNGGERTNQMDPVTFDGRSFKPPKGRCWSYRSRRREDEAISPMERLEKSGRLCASGDSLDGKRYLDDFPFKTISNWWDGLGGAADPIYVVQTNTEIVRRCVLMTTDPGDLVLDPTCGSGTTAFVAEQWGRRWITCDTSRVAVALARQRLLTARFPYYRLRSSRVRDGFDYEIARHIDLGDIANNARLDACKTKDERDRLISESGVEVALYDQPNEDRQRVRVAGPFTVEAIPVAAIDDPGANVAPLSSDARDDDIARGGRGERTADPAGDYVGMMMDLVRKTGVAFKGGRRLGLPTLRSVKGPYTWLHAESETDSPGDPRRVAVSFGPAHAPVTPRQVLDTISETRGYDVVLFIGFACDPEALRMIDVGAHGRELHFAHAAPDILVGGGGLDLLKTTKATKLFTVFGVPDVKVHKESEGHVSVELTHVDVYDPTTGETHEYEAEKDIAAWFVDHDYDGRTFCICQALFPGTGSKNPWEKLQKALRGTIDEGKFEALRGTRSLPFKPGARLAVQVIDDRGNEVMKVVDRSRG